MSNDRFQYTIAEILVGTFWAAMTCLAWTHVTDRWNELLVGISDPISALISLAVVYFSVVGPFVTVGAFIRKKRLAFIVSTIAAVVLLPLAYLIESI